jgi:predicted methyltransferase
MSIVLSHFQASVILDAYRSGLARIEVSPDLGLSKVEVVIQAGSVLFPGGESVDIGDQKKRPAKGTLRDMANSDTKCFLVEGSTVSEIRAYSEVTGWVRSLFPTRGAPTMLVSGIPMHRVKDTEPMADTLAKMAAVGAVRGKVLDTATGLGYTAIVAARTASEVVTVEIDPAAIAVARQNPWSRELFSNPRIRLISGDCAEVIEGFDDGEFSAILHDPPTFQLGGELYAESFYRQLNRVLSRDGKLFHYVGDPDSGLGQRMTQGVIKRLREAGFTRVTRKPEAFGVLASRS